MNPEQIQIVCPQTLETRFDAFEQMLPRSAALVGPGVELSAGLGSENDLVPVSPERLADKLLRSTVMVDVGRIDEVNAQIKCPTHDGGRTILIHLEAERVGAHPEC